MLTREVEHLREKAKEEFLHGQLSQQSSQENGQDTYSITSNYVLG